MNVLIHFGCTCGYTEDIGIDPRCGIIINGSVTLVCPTCGAITHVERQHIMLPVRFQALQKKAPPV